MTCCVLVLGKKLPSISFKLNQEVNSSTMEDDC